MAWSCCTNEDIENPFTQTSDNNQKKTFLVDFNETLWDESKWTIESMKYGKRQCLKGKSH
jgi:hypothetical protein